MFLYRSLFSRGFISRYLDLAFSPMDQREFWPFSFAKNLNGTPDCYPFYRVSSQHFLIIDFYIKTLLWRNPADISIARLLANRNFVGFSRENLDIIAISFEHLSFSEAVNLVFLS